MADIVTDLGVNKNWKAYKNGHNTFTITLTESAAAFDISSYVFTLEIFTPGGDTSKLTLTEGSGITNGGATGIITIVLTQTQASTTLPRADYFYVLSYIVNSVKYRFFQGNLTLSTETNPASATTSVSQTVSLSGSSVTAAVTLTNAFAQIPTNRQIASYTLVLTDAGKLVETNVASANNLTVPPNSSVAFALGTQVLIAQYGAGQTTVVAGSGVTIRSTGGALKIAGQYSAGTLVKIGLNEWYLFGDLSA